MLVRRVQPRECRVHHHDRGRRCGIAIVEESSGQHLESEDALQRWTHRFQLGSDVVSVHQQRQRDVEAMPERNLGNISRRLRTMQLVHALKQRLVQIRHHVLPFVAVRGQSEVRDQNMIRSISERHVAQRVNRAQQQPAGYQQRQRHRHFCAHQHRPHPVVAAPAAGLHASLPQCRLDRRPHREPRRPRRRHQRCHDGESAKHS